MQANPLLRNCHPGKQQHQSERQAPLQCTMYTVHAIAKYAFIMRLNKHHLTRSHRRTRRLGVRSVKPNHRIQVYHMTTPLSHCKVISINDRKRGKALESI